jgi:AraC-like DNA-binding protein
LFNAPREGGNKMAAPLLTLDNIAPKHRLASWKEAVCETFVRLECECDYSQLLHGRLQAGMLGQLHVARVSSAPQVVKRTSTLVRQAHEGYVLVSLQTRGRTVIEQDGRQAVLQPGMIGFYDSDRPYLLHLPDGFDQIVLHLPRSEFAAMSSHWMNRTAVGMGVSNPYVASLFALAPRLMALLQAPGLPEAHKTAQVASDLMTLALSQHEQDSPEPSYSARSSGSDIIWREAHRVMQQELDNHQLGAEMVAAMCKVSVRRLQEVFQHHGATLSETLWGLRLDQAHAHLQQKALLHQTITTIAINAGFSDMAHFSRRFKQRFGVAPSELRKVLGRP